MEYPLVKIINQEDIKKVSPFVVQVSLFYIMTSGYNLTRMHAASL